MISFHFIELLINGLAAEDNRPVWLREMPSASDNTALYYQFFHLLVQRIAPVRVLEIGTYLGSSACHFGYANTGGLVRTIDCDPEAKLAVERAAAGRIFNIDAVTSDSLQWARTHQEFYDILFIDGQHTAYQAGLEYDAFRPLVRTDGIIFFDDIDLGDMPAFWNSVFDPKIRLDTLHYTGFGCCRVER